VGDIRHDRPNFADVIVPGAISHCASTGRAAPGFIQRLISGVPMTALPPRPTHNFHPLRFSLPIVVSESERRRMIESAAYLRAEARHFEPGHEVEDWLAAEAEVDNRLSYVRRLAGIDAG
jgi:hypothetical protein